MVNKKVKFLEIELRKIVCGFRKGLLGSKHPEDMCFWVCSPLVGYLQFLGYSCVLVQGIVKGNGHHYWIKLSNELIIDPTASQFRKSNGTKMPAVYIGEKPEWYLEKL